MKQLKFALTTAIIFVTIDLFASNQFIINPSPFELNTYKTYNNQILKEASSCLEDVWKVHTKYFQDNGISKFYGDRDNRYNTAAERKKETENIIRAREKARLAKQNLFIDYKRLLSMKNNNDQNIGPFYADFLRRKKELDHINYLLNTQEPMSCIGLVRRCLEQGFYSTKNKPMENLWNKINSNLIKSTLIGTVLIENLQKLNWKVTYWNPDPAKNELWDDQDAENWKDTERLKMVGWVTPLPAKNFPKKYYYYAAMGLHANLYKQVIENNSYFKFKVDDKESLVNFKKGTPDLLLKSPYYIGTAHLGYHMFSGHHGLIFEGHSERSITSPSGIERGYFNPDVKGGSPKSTNKEQYRSGLFAIPPVY